MQNDGGGDDGRGHRRAPSSSAPEAGLDEGGFDRDSSTGTSSGARAPHRGGRGHDLSVASLRRASTSPLDVPTRTLRLTEAEHTSRERSARPAGGLIAGVAVGDVDRRMTTPRRSRTRYESPLDPDEFRPRNRGASPPPPPDRSETAAGTSHRITIRPLAGRAVGTGVASVANRAVSFFFFDAFVLQTCVVLFFFGNTDGRLDPSLPVSDIAICFRYNGIPLPPFKIQFREEGRATRVAVGTPTSSRSGKQGPSHRKVRRWNNDRISSLADEIAKMSSSKSSKAAEVLLIAHRDAHLYRPICDPAEKSESEPLFRCVVTFFPLFSS